MDPKLTHWFLRSPTVLRCTARFRGGWKGKGKFPRPKRRRESSSVQFHKVTLKPILNGHCHMDKRTRFGCAAILWQSTARPEVGRFAQIRRPLEEGPPGCEASARSSIFDLGLRWNHITALNLLDFHILDPLQGQSFISHVSCLRSC